MLSEAQRFWDSIVGKVRKTAREEAKNAFRCERHEVTTAPDGTKIGVTLPMGTKEIFLPYSQEVADATVGTPVLVVWWGSMSNAKVCFFADGYKGSSLRSPLDVWRVGSYYWSDDDTDPAQLFGGTWEQIEDMFLLAAGSTYAAGSTGGDSSVTLTTDEIPAHTHGSKTITGSFNIKKANSSGGSANNVAGASGIVSIDHSAGVQYNQLSPVTTNKEASKVTINATHEHDSVGGGQAHNNMPPYLAAYCWHRIA